jgi:hypothetical protein
MPVVNHANSVTQLERLFLIVRDQDRRDAELSLDDLQRFAQLGADRDVQRSEGLVQQQDRRRVGQGAGQRHALLLTTGELIRVAIAQPGKAGELEQLLPSGTPLPRRPPCGCAARIRCSARRSCGGTRSSSERRSRCAPAVEDP